MSETMMLIEFVAGAVLGVHVNWPLAELIAALGGEPAPRLKLSDCAGTSVSVALAVKLRVCPSVTDCGPIGVKVGGVFDKKFAAPGVGGVR